MRHYISNSRWCAILLGCILAHSAFSFYDPSAQRWVNRDPVDERGFAEIGRSISRKANSEDNLYTFVKQSPVSQIDYFGLFLGFNYGNYCGWSRRGPGDPIGGPDGVDAACQKHDECLGTWADACKFKFCNIRFCKNVARANCHGDKVCKKAKRKILAGCALIVPIPPFIFM